MRKKVLLGATKDKELVFANFEVTKRNGYPEFTASFDCVRPFRESEVDYKAYCEEYLDTMDAAEKLYLLEKYDCRPSELSDCLMNDLDFLRIDLGYDVMAIIDCSLYPEIMFIDGEDWYFESSACGQHDTRDHMEIYTNKLLYDQVHELWDKYHLREVGEDIIEAVEELKRRFDEIDEEQWIEDYIREYIINAEGQG